MLEASKVNWTEEAPAVGNIVIEFQCTKCGTLQLVEYDYDNLEGDSTADSIHHHCVCGVFYKKAGRIPETARTRVGWYS